jgi:PilZ domain
VSSRGTAFYVLSVPPPLRCMLGLRQVSLRGWVMVRVMMLAEVTIDGDPSTYAAEALVFLFLVGGALFLLTTVVLAQNPIASDAPQRKIYVPKEDSFSAASDQEGTVAGQPQTSRKRGRAPRVSDKRRSIRRGGNAVPVVVSDILEPQQLIPGVVLNRSRGGLSLSVPQKLEVGRLIAVRTPDFPDCLASVRLRVRHCKEKGDKWQVGCQFMEELPWSVLLIFG